MPITYTLDHERQLIHAKVTGDLTIAETIAYFDRLQQDAGCPQAAIEVVDFTEVSNFSIYYDDMQIITQKYQGAKETRHILATIFNCPSALSYGIGRMLEALHTIENVRHDVVIVRCRQEIFECIEILRSKQSYAGDYR